jgi:hypothetical protein
VSYAQFIPSPEEFPHHLFEQVSREITNEDIICDVGCGFGYSTCYMTECLVASDKRPKFYAFDQWGIGDEEPFPVFTQWGEPFDQWMKRVGGPAALLDQFLFHLRNNPCRERLTDWAQFPSHTICNNFADQSVVFAFLHASRDRERVLREIRGWWPKISKNGGKLAVLGVAEDGVSQAVKEYCADSIAIDFRDNTYILFK